MRVGTEAPLSKYVLNPKLHQIVQKGMMRNRGWINYKRARLKRHTVPMAYRYIRARILIKSLKQIIRQRTNNRIMAEQ